MRMDDGEGKMESKLAQFRASIKEMVNSTQDIDSTSANTVAKAAQDARIVHSSTGVSMIIHNNAPSWQEMAVHACFDAWIRMRQQYLVSRRHKSSDGAKAHQISFFISEINHHIGYCHCKMEPVIQTLEIYRSECSMLGNILGLSDSDSEEET